MSDQRKPQVIDAANCSSITAHELNEFQILKPQSTLIEITKWPPFFKKYEALRAKILACTIEYPLTVISYISETFHSFPGDTMLIGPYLEFTTITHNI